MLYEEKVIICNEAPFNGKWFYVNKGIKRWITTISAAVDNGIDITKIETVSKEEAGKYKNGKFLVKNIKVLEDITNLYEARSYFLKNLSGYGIEFGAATLPSPVPDNCKVEYADFFQVDEGCNKDFVGDFVNVTFNTSLDEMKGIDDNSLDFIINCHVIEHVPQTLRALKLCYSKLKSGGVLFMAIPHMKYTFDALRPLTTINHFIEDYNNYVKERDILHLVDYLEGRAAYKAKNEGNIPERMTLYPLLLDFINGGKIDIHYHTFTEKNFSELLNYFNINIAKWGKTDIIPRIPFEDSNEFYVRLVK